MSLSMLKGPNDESWKVFVTLFAMVSFIYTDDASLLLQ